MRCLFAFVPLTLLSILRLDAYLVHSLSFGSNALRSRAPISNGSFLGFPRQITPCRTTLRSSSLSMHMGHSHSHHHHHHHDHHEDLDKESSPAKRGMKRRRRVALFVFAAMAILGLPSIRNHSLPGRSDLVAFGFSCAALATLDAVRKELSYALGKMKRFRDGVMKYTPAMASMFAELMPFIRRSNDSNNERHSSSASAAANAAASAKAAADRVTVLGAMINLLLSLGKFVVGITCHSSALIADAGHSLSDLLSDFVTLFTVQIARLPADDDHPYGHGKFEAIGSLFLALTLLGTGVGIATVANKELIQILTAQTQHKALAANFIQLPKAPALIMAVISIFSKEWLFRVTRRVGEKLNSQVVIANAWHHRSDAYSSIMAFISIGVAMFIPGFRAADSAAGLLVAGMICMTGADILIESIHQLSDSNNDDIVQKATKIVTSYKDVVDVKRIRARQVGSAAFVDVSITTSNILSSSATHTVEQRIGRQILDELKPHVIDVEVHACDSSSNNHINNRGIDLESNNWDDNDYYSHRHHDVEEEKLPCATEVERTVQEIICLQYGRIISTNSVTVNYYEEHRGMDLRQHPVITVDVNIGMQPNSGDASITYIHELASKIKRSLENNNLIRIAGANIFLDLNQKETYNGYEEDDMTASLLSLLPSSSSPQSLLLPAAPAFVPNFYQNSTLAP